MRTPVYRLPVGVGCSSDSNVIRVSGEKEVVEFNSRSKVYRKGDIVVFLPHLSSYDSSLFTQAVSGVVFNHTKRLYLKGIGYRVREEKGKLIFFLGYSKPVMLSIPKNIFVTFDKKSFLLTSSNLGVLQNFVGLIRSYRVPDPYKGAGILYFDEVIFLKEGKKS